VYAKKKDNNLPKQNTGLVNPFLTYFQVPKVIKKRVLFQKILKWDF